MVSYKALKSGAAAIGLAGVLSECSLKCSSSQPENLINDTSKIYFLPHCVKLKFVERWERGGYFLCEGTGGKEILYIKHY